MGFAGNLRTLSLAEVVQTLNRIKADGVLRLASPGATRDLVFSGGEIIAVEAPDGSAQRALLRRLVLAARTKTPSPDEFEAAERTINTLVELGTISTEQLQQEAQQQALEELYDLNTWPAADFVFHELAESEEWQTQVDKAKQQPLSINVNSVLMEAARRLDEWEMLKGVFSDTDVVDLQLDQEQGLESCTSEYPGSVIVPMLIEGCMAIEDVMLVTGVTRFATYALFDDLRKEGLLTVLSREEVAEEADRLAATGDHVRAAQLYRRALAQNEAGSGIMAKLASSLEQVGDAPNAAGCYAQLALAQMDKGHGEPAILCAQRAIELAPQDPQAHVALVRCRIGCQQIDEAVVALRDLARLYHGLGRVEDARASYRKILELTPGDDISRHALAAIQVSGEGGESGDVVVCVECGTVNNREQDACTNCGARLHLQCLTCTRTVSVADRVCVFCGADPHRQPTDAERERRAPVSLSTERVADTAKVKGDIKDKGSAFWRAELRRLLDEARAHEAAGRLDEALTAWREVARLQTDNAELTQHIRELESLVHDRFTEVEIERGNRLKHQRRYWRALIAYRAALRSIGEQDPRAPRLRELIATTSRSNTRIMAIYFAAFAILAITAVLVSRPYLDVRMIEGRSADWHARLAAPIPEVGAISEAEATYIDIAARAEKLSGGHRTRASVAVDSLAGDLLQARERFLAEELRQIETAIAAKSPDQALARIAAAGPVVGTLGDERLKTARERAEQAKRALLDADKQRAQAPALLDQAKAAEKAGELATAMRLYREVASAGAGDVSEQASAAAKGLEPQAAAFTKAWQDIDALIGRDLLKARGVIEQLSAEAVKWGASEALAAKRQQVANGLAAAETAWRALAETGDVAALQAFLTTHGGSPQATSARARLAQLQAAGRAREGALASYREAVKTKQWETAFTLATALHQNHGATLAAGEAPIPVQLSTEPAGAQVLIDGKEAGRTPYVLALEPKAPPREIRLTAPGYRPVVVPVAEIATRWNWSFSMDRDALWSVPLGKPIGLIHALSDGGSLVTAGDTLVRLLADGKQAWSRSVDAADLGAMGALHGPAPVDLGGGNLGLSLGPTGFIVIDGEGHVQRTVRPEEPVLGRAARYTSDILGGQERLAFAADALYAGPVVGEPTRIPLPAAAIDGPVVLTGELDRLLVVADIRGHFVAIEESTQRVAWDKDMRFAELSGLTINAQNQALGIVDGSRLVGWTLSATEAAEAWSRRLTAPAVGAIASDSGIISLASGQEVVRTRPNGSELPSLALPSPASAGVVTAGEHLAVGCRQHVVVFKAGRLSWASPCPAPVTAVAVGGGRVLVGLADGTVAAFQP